MKNDGVQEENLFFCDLIGVIGVAVAVSYHLKIIGPIGKITMQGIGLKISRSVFLFGFCPSDGHIKKKLMQANLF